MAAKKQQNRVNSDRTGKAAGSRKSVRSGAQGASEGRKPGRPRRVQEPEPEHEYNPPKEKSEHVEINMIDL